MLDQPMSEQPSSGNKKTATVVKRLDKNLTVLTEDLLIDAFGAAKMRLKMSKLNLV